MILIETNQYNVGTAHTMCILVITVNLRGDLEIFMKLMAYFAESDSNNGLNIPILRLSELIYK